MPGDLHVGRVARESIRRGSKLSSRRRRPAGWAEPRSALTVSSHCRATADARSRLTAAKSPRCPLCIHSQRPCRKGWQFVCWTVEPLEARMCAKTSREATCMASSRRLRSFQAGSVPWKTPGEGWAPYQPTPKPSPLDDPALLSSAWGDVEDPTQG